MKHSFTLIELCVCLVLTIAVLLIVGQAGAHAADKAKRTACTMRLKNIVSAVFAYSNDYADYSVPAKSGNVFGWPRILSRYQPRLTDESYRCPDDNVKRNWDGVPISFSLNVGHIWNVAMSTTNKKEWGMVSVITGTPLRISKAPEPSDTVLMFEFWNQYNNFRQINNSNDWTCFSTYSQAGTHENGKENTLLWLDGHVSSIVVAEWQLGDKRGVIYKNLHKGCDPNFP